MQTIGTSLLFRISSGQNSDNEDKPSDESDTKMLTASLPYSTEQDRYLKLIHTKHFSANSLKSS